MSGLTTTEVIESSPGRDVAVERRSIQMRQFKTKTNILACVRDQVVVPLGQIAGSILEIQEKPGTLPNGEPKTSLLAIGEFEAICYETGEVMTAYAAYLPGYFAQALKVNLENGRGGMIGIGIEIVAEPTGLDEKTGLAKAIPFAYGVRNLLGRRADSPLEDVKRRMASKGMLKLSPPQAPPVKRLELPSSALGGQTEIVPDGEDMPLAEGEAPEPVENVAVAASPPVASRKKAA